MEASDLYDFSMQVLPPEDQDKVVMDKWATLGRGIACNKNVHIEDCYKYQTHIFGVFKPMNLMW